MTLWYLGLRRRLARFLCPEAFQALEDQVDYFRDVAVEELVHCTALDSRVNELERCLRGAGILVDR
jgi:hypothetical protein